MVRAVQALLSKEEEKGNIQKGLRTVPRMGPMSRAIHQG